MLEEFRKQDLIWDKANATIHQAVSANSGDENGRKLNVQVVNGSTVEDLTGSTLSLSWRTLTGEHYGLDVFEAIDAATGKFELFYTTEMLSNKGRLSASLVLIDSVGRVESNPFRIMVKESNVDGDAVQSQNSFTALTEALVKVEAWNGQFEEKYNGLEEEYATNLTALDAQLAQKATKGDISVTDINKNKGLLDETYMSDTFKEQMAGTTPIGSTPPDKSITAIKTTFFKQNKNKFSGSWVAGSITDTGAEQSTTSGMRNPEHTEVFSDTTYTATFTGVTGVHFYYAFYDSNKTFISRIGSGENTYTFTTPINAKYMKFATYKADSNGVGTTPATTQLELGHLSTEYVEPRLYFDPNYLDMSEVIPEKSITPEKTSFLQLNKNKFTTQWELGFIDASGDDQNSRGGRTGYNPIKGNETYTVQILGVVGVHYYAQFYDIDKNHIEWIGFDTSNINTFTTPANAHYVRFKIYELEESGAVVLPTETQLELGSVATDIVGSGYELSESYINKKLIIDDVEKEVADITLMKNQFVNEVVKGVAHRGFSLDAPENTIPAYKLAREKGFKYVECDIQFSSDGVPVLIHDSTIDRTSNGTGNVIDLTLAQLKSFDFGNWKDPIYEGTQIPTFEEFLLACKKLNLHPYIEMKSHLDTEQAGLLVSIVRNLGMLRKVSWLGFFDDLDLIREYDSKARIAGLAGAAPTELSGWVSRITEPGNVFLDMDYNYVTQEVSQMCMDAEIPLEVFTVNDPDAVLTLAQFNVSAITTDGLNIPKILADSV